MHASKLPTLSPPAISIPEPDHLVLEESSRGEIESALTYGRLGGHHPIHLGDHLGDGRYRIIHKLGSGGFANVWLCRDMKSREITKYVALKVLLSGASVGDDCDEMRVSKMLGKLHLDMDQEAGAKYICLPSDHFEIDGPNGSHRCFVYPVLGPTVTAPILRKFESPDKVLRNICLKVVQAIDFLHGHGICHGDLTPFNILLQTSGLDGLSEDEIIHMLGEPRKVRVLTQSGENPTEPTAPKYLVRPVDWNSTSIDLKFVSDQPCVIDLGQSFQVTDPPRDFALTPEPYQSPELMLDKALGLGCDLWALGCTLFEIRTGGRLFGKWANTDDAYLCDMANTLGKFPEPWWSTTWESRKKWYKDEVDSQGRVISILNDLAKDNVVPEEPESNRDIHPSGSLQGKLAQGLRYEVGWPSWDSFSRDISADEIEMFSDLLGKLVKFDPKDRLTAKAAQDHEWFKM
ncbi:uncharacterized protein BP5553_04276 [Venustampulla echinocandica]|uniref:Protein kinase domain-containing protein n=1 Tax=Venustampulla echinocandica TaxID=2656787 RepID=A0A370TWM7_9HELO|nr:uncharacterized protein BP5553_04276 [Venustampulla echinocandica]RDL39936.1 hypothetical protein BP5553_04276 [Venustampulla echinocandica]